MNTCKLKNISGEVQDIMKYWGVDEEYVIPDNLRFNYSRSSNVLQAIADEVLQVGDGTNYFTDLNEQLCWLKDEELEPEDSDGSRIIRPKYNPAGWHFEPRALKFTCGTYNSLVNKRLDDFNISNCSDIGDVTLKFYDEDGNQLTKGETETDEEFQIRLDSDCTATFMDWWPDYDMEIISAMFGIKNPPTGDDQCHAWCLICPDIAREYGGSVPFVDGGIDLSFAAEKCCIHLDGRCSKRLNNCRSFPYTNKIRLGLIHSPGVKTAFQVLFEHYKA